MRRVLKRYVLMLLVLLFIGGCYLYYSNKTALRPIEFVYCDSVEDLSPKGFLGDDWEKSVVTYYNWQGIAQWSITSPMIDYDRDNNFLASAGDLWSSPDYQQYHSANGIEFDRWNRIINPGFHLWRLSSNNNYVGLLDFPHGAIQVSLYRRNQLQWRKRVTYTPRGTFNGNEPIDLLVDNEGRVLLYSPHVMHYQQDSAEAFNKAYQASFPPPTPLAVIDQARVSTVDAKSAMDTMVAAYLRTNPRSTSLPPSTWSMRDSVASSPYRQSVLIFPHHSIWDIYTRVQVYRYPHIRQASLRGRIVVSHEGTDMQIVFPDGTKMLFRISMDFYEDVRGTVIFSPDNHHLLLRGVGNNRAGWGLFEYQ